MFLCKCFSTNDFLVGGEEWVSEGGWLLLALVAGALTASFWIWRERWLRRRRRDGKR
jgi:hypothetical protein